MVLYHPQIYTNYCKFETKNLVYIYKILYKLYYVILWQYKIHFWTSCEIKCAITYLQRNTVIKSDFKLIKFFHVIIKY